MGLTVTLNKPTSDVFEEVVNDRVPGLRLIDKGQTWLIETLSGSTGGFLEQPGHWLQPAMLTFQGKGISGFKEVMNLLKDAIPDLDWE
jgi:hypothetical protein